MLYTEKFAVCSQIHTKHTNKMWAKRRFVECYPRSMYIDHSRMFYLETHFVPLRNIFSSPL